MGRLTDVHIRNWIANGKPLAKSDGDNLTFTLSEKGTAAWTLRYRFHGERKEMTLGRYPDISLAKARLIAADRRADVQQGINIGAVKRRVRKEADRSWPFKRLAEDYLAKAPTLSKPLAATTIKGHSQRFRDYVYPKIGNSKATDVDPYDVVLIVEAAAKKSLHVARSVLGVVRRVFTHGVANQVVPFNPCAHLTAEAIIGGRPAARLRINLTDKEIEEVLPALDGLGKQNSLMVRLLLATGARIGELVNAEWSHIDFEKAIWTIPLANIKGKKNLVPKEGEIVNFLIPLPPVVASWFAELYAISFGSKYVLPNRSPRGEKIDKPMTPATLNAALEKLTENLKGKCRRFTPHDLRSTMRSHLGELEIDVLIAERCLNHSLGGMVAIYDKHDYLTARRRALETWIAKLASIEQGDRSNVVLLRKA